MIEINNFTDYSIEEKLLKKIASKILEKERKEKKALSIALVDSREIQRLNREYRRKDMPTDVLSFPSIADSEIDFPEAIKENNLGEVIICPEQVKENSNRYNTTFKRELVSVLIHGILHLLGYDHE